MHTGTDPALYWIGLSRIEGVGRVTFRKLAARFGAPEHVLSASREELAGVDGVSGKVAKAIASASWRQFAEQELEKAKQAGVRIITADSTDYPERLRNTPDPPLFLYVNGTLDQGEGIAVVGTRKPTVYGMTVAKRLSAELAEAGLTIVSGLARGIDTQAHRGALAAKGRTIAVLGSGIDVAYPPENRELMRQIAQAGAVVSENPFGTQPEAGYFPARNRIISGLSLGTVIVEAAVDSGSLITAQYALEQKRKLFAIPGNIASPNSRGTHSLIRQGALLVEGSGDILRELGKGRNSGARRQLGRSQPVLDTDEQAALRCIQDEPKHIDRVMKESGLAAGKLSAVLISLELKGLVNQVPGKQYVRSYDAEVLEA
jgi:DNA processing protein